MINAEDAVRLAYTLDIYGSQKTAKIEALSSPINMSQKDIEDVLTTIAESSHSPVLGG